MESRELEYFVAVAEELNFGRAAERLGMAQPPLSRAVQRLERRLGVVLLERTSRQVRLTRAGEVLLDEGRGALRALEAAARRAKRADPPRLVCVSKPGGDAGLLAPILTRYAADPDAVEVEVSICGIAEQEGLLRDGHADVAMLRLPYDNPSGFETEELLTERAVAVLPRGHHLACRGSITMADLAGETFPRWYQDEAGAGPLVRDSGQLMQLISLGRTVAVLPESCEMCLRDDLVTVPVTDGEPTTLVLAWPEAARSRALAAFVRIATEVAGAGVAA